MQDYLLSKSTISISENLKPVKPIMNRKPMMMQNSDGMKRQASSGSVLNRKNALTIDGTSLKTRAVSHGNMNNRTVDHDNALETSSISSKLKRLSLSKLFKSFQINDDAELNNFTRMLTVSYTHLTLPTILRV